MSLPVTNLEPFYVVDTHALIWYLINDKKLSPSAKRIFEAAERNQTLLIISAIVIAELYYSNAKNKWFADFLTVYTDIISKPYIYLMPLEHHHILDFTKDKDVPEMHDRIITGIARRLDAPLISSDPLIIEAKIVRIIW